MITAIHLGNFKAFAESQRIPLRPLTLIYGANSSGKSSIIHGLILARHAMETGELDVHRTDIGGEAVDLGGFKQFIHRRDTDLRLQFEWNISSKDFSKRLKDLLPNTQNATISISIGLIKISFRNVRNNIRFSIFCRYRESLARIKNNTSWICWLRH